MKPGLTQALSAVTLIGAIAVAYGLGRYHGPADAPAVAGATDTTAPSAKKPKLLYYRNPMGLADTSPVPKKDSMGMDYIPVYESEVAPTVADHAADRFYDPKVMAGARGLLKQEHGGEPVSLFSLNIFELQARKDNEGADAEDSGE